MSTDFLIKENSKSGRNTATTINYSYKFDRELANFNDGYEIRTTVDKDLILVQYSSDAPDASLCYWTTVDEANRITTLNDYMDKLALSKDWGNRNTVKVARIPAGIEVKYAVGTAREQLLIADPRPGARVRGYYLESNPIAKGNAYVLPIYINGCEVSLYIAVDSDVTIGQMPVTRKLAVKAGSVDEGDKHTVLIVDDSGMSRMMLRNILEDAGYCIVAEASDGLEGELAYKQYAPDVVTLDITMPNMDGIECLEKIMDYDPDANVIMITAAGQQNKVIKALKEGAKKFITKPYNVEDVLKNIGDMVE